MTHLLAVIAFVLLFTHSPASGKEVVASTLYLFNGSPELTESGTSRGGTWSLGRNGATVGLTQNFQPAGGPLTGNYTGTGSDQVVAELQINAVKATAHSEIAWIAAGTPTDCPGALTCYTMKLTATSNGGLFTFSRPSGGVARGNDPQFIETRGSFAQVVSLDAGSKMFAERPDNLDVARSTLILTAPDLDEPLAFIDLLSTGGLFDATVRFAHHPDLRYLLPGTSSVPITDAEVELALESSTLGTEDGLSNKLALFTWAYDLSSHTLSTDAAFGSDFVNIAQSVPAPGTLLLLINAILLLALFATRGKTLRALTV